MYTILIVGDRNSFLFIFFVVVIRVRPSGIIVFIFYNDYIIITCRHKTKQYNRFFFYFKSLLTSYMCQRACCPRDNANTYTYYLLYLQPRYNIMCFICIVFGRETRVFHKRYLFYSLFTPSSNYSNYYAYDYYNIIMLLTIVRLRLIVKTKIEMDAAFIVYSNHITMFRHNSLIL